MASHLQVSLTIAWINGLQKLVFRAVSAIRLGESLRVHDYDIYFSISLSQHRAWRKLRSEEMSAQRGEPGDLGDPSGSADRHRNTAEAPPGPGTLLSLPASVLWSSGSRVQSPETQTTGSSRSAPTQTMVSLMTDCTEMPDTKAVQKETGRERKLPHQTLCHPCTSVSHSKTWIIPRLQGLLQMLEQSPLWCPAGS